MNKPKFRLEETLRRTRIKTNSPNIKYLNNFSSKYYKQDSSYKN